jgi:hypothetical protein
LVVSPLFGDQIIMQIINNTEVFEPKECLFALSSNPDDVGSIMIAITDKATWNREGCLNDGFGDHSLPKGTLPKEISNIMEAIWETEMSIEDVRTVLLSAGFVESPELFQVLAGYLPEDE